MVKVSTYNVRDPGSIPGSRGSPGEGNSNPLQYSCLENPMDEGAWQAIVHGVAKSQTRLSNFTYEGQGLDSGSLRGLSGLRWYLETPNILEMKTLIKYLRFSHQNENTPDKKCRHAINIGLIIALILQQIRFVSFKKRANLILLNMYPYVL